MIKSIATNQNATLSKNDTIISRQDGGITSPHGLAEEPTHIKDVSGLELLAEIGRDKDPLSFCEALVPHTETESNSVPTGGGTTNNHGHQLLFCWLHLSMWDRKKRPFQMRFWMLW
jgi:hypothetical protein